MFTKADMQVRVRGMLSVLPEEMSRDECADFVRTGLYDVLGLPKLEDSKQNPIRAEWIGDKLHVQVPTRLHYAEHIIDIKEAIDHAIERVNLTDTRQLSPCGFADLMCRLRGRK